MVVQELLSLAISSGAALYTEDGKIFLEGEARAREKLLPLLREHKPMLLAYFYESEERAAIMEFDGGLTREEALQCVMEEKLAWMKEMMERDRAPHATFVSFWQDYVSFVVQNYAHESEGYHSWLRHPEALAFMNYKNTKLT